jgi:hypothetical protein
VKGTSTPHCSVNGCTEFNRYPSDRRLSCSKCGLTVCGFHTGAKVIVNGKPAAECTPCIVKSYEGMATNKNSKIPRTRVPSISTRKLNAKQRGNRHT